jgi:uncharacterized protein involved in outer membrane biogenesis
MRRRRTLWFSIAGALLVLGGAFLWGLPEIVRRQAVARIPTLTGRAVSIEDVDLNLFTGRLAVKKFRLAERDPAQAFVELERLDLRVALLPLVAGHVRLTELVLTEPRLRLIRTGPGEFNFSDILARFPAAGGAAPKTGARWAVSVDRLAVRRAAVLVSDQAVSPAAEWRVQDVSVEAGGLTTRPAQPPGRMSAQGRVNEAALGLAVDSVRLTPASFSARLSIERFDLARLRPYLPSTLPALPASGMADINLALKVEMGPEGMRQGVAVGDVELDALALVQPGRPAPFLTVPRLGVVLKEADLVARTATVAAVRGEGLDLQARRDARGAIDILGLLKPREGSPGAPAAAGAAAPAAAPGGEGQGYRIALEKIELARGKATFTDEAVSPTTTLILSDLAFTVEGATWPASGPAAFRLAAGLPGGGRVEINGSARLDPLDAEFQIMIRDAPIEPYQAYLPFRARLEGRFNGDSRNRLRIADGRVTALSKGNSWATDLAIRAPGAQGTVARLDRLEINGIDFSWPTHARVVQVKLKRPAAEVERAEDGTFSVQGLFTPRFPGPPAGARPAAETASPHSAPPRKGLLQTMAIQFGEIAIEDGYIRFLDRTTTPDFSEDVSGLMLSVKRLSNRPAQRAQVLLQGVVGGDAALDVRGEVAPLGEDPYFDVVGELKKFPLAAVNPYMDNLLAWIIRRGQLEAKLHYRLEKGELTGDNDVLVGRLRVAPSGRGDEVKRRIGLPLDLIVALITDSTDSIRLRIPVSGTLAERRFDFGEAIWTAVRNVITNIVAAPFRAIGRLFTRGETIEQVAVNPVVFAPGSPVISPEMERHLVRVADFLRRAPTVGLTLRPVAAQADVEALKERELTARLAQFQQERNLGDLAAAVQAWYRLRLPEHTPPKTLPEQIALLREREPVPAGPLADLLRRRVQATRERLTAVEGVQPERLKVAEPPAAEPAVAAGEGRVEFDIVAEAD